VFCFTTRWLGARSTKYIYRRHVGLSALTASWCFIVGVTGCYNSELVRLSSVGKTRCYNSKLSIFIVDT